MSTPHHVDIRNRRASFEFSLLERFTAGIQLSGSEIKSIRLGKANITDGFCAFHGNELFVRNIEIAEYHKVSFFGHSTKRDRKLLLHKHEIKKLQNRMKDQGLAIVPLRMFINEKGWAKLEIALAKGKKLYDKREDIKKRDIQRETGRRMK